VPGLGYRRVQFTNDMLPADLLGINVFQPADGQFKFHPGPIFHHFLLADEINRASPKMQSALLEAMEEKQVSVDGKTYRLPKPFFVIATQNPIEQLGTFPLPESQLDRFMMRLSLGYPSAEAERRLYAQGDRRQLLPALKAVCNAEILLQWQAQAAQVKCSQQAADYVYRLVQSTRQPGLFVTGLRPRPRPALGQTAPAPPCSASARGCPPAMPWAIADQTNPNYAPHRACTPPSDASYPPSASPDQAPLCTGACPAPAPHLPQARKTAWSFDNPAPPGSPSHPL